MSEQLQGKINACYVALEDAMVTVQETWEEKVLHMEADSTIKDKELLWNSGIVLGIVILLFFVHSVPSVHLGLGWIAVLGIVFKQLFIIVLDYPIVLSFSVALAC